MDRPVIGLRFKPLGNHRVVQWNNIFFAIQVLVQWPKGCEYDGIICHTSAPGGFLEWFDVECGDVIARFFVLNALLLDFGS